MTHFHASFKHVMGQHPTFLRTWRSHLHLPELPLQREDAATRRRRLAASARRQAPHAWRETHGIDPGVRMMSGLR